MKCKAEGSLFAANIKNKIKCTPCFSGEFSVVLRDIQKEE